MIKKNVINALVNVPWQTYNKNYLKNYYYSNVDGDLSSRIKTHKKFSFKKNFDEWFISKMDLNGEQNNLILDVGCGTGNFLLPLAEKIKNMGSYIIGVDLSKAYVNYLQNIIINSKLPATVIEGDIEKIIFPQIFNKILCNYTLYHIKNIKKAISRLRSIILDNGLLYIMTNSEKTMPEFEKINQLALTEVLGYKVPVSQRVESRFCSENALGYLKDSFRLRKQIAYNDKLIFHNENDFSIFYFSSRTRNKFYLTTEQYNLLKIVIKKIALRELKNNNSIVVNKKSHLFILSPI
ncbi:class I SAM-dependent methyltransferase [Patescibacteria group bacterium]|nr:class I SAM-dependent methyltransferase [Patescibacteria group bacterium]